MKLNDFHSDKTYCHLAGCRSKKKWRKAHMHFQSGHYWCKKSCHRKWQEIKKFCEHCGKPCHDEYCSEGCEKEDRLDRM